MIRGELDQIKGVIKDMNERISEASSATARAIGSDKQCLEAEAAVNSREVQ